MKKYLLILPVLAVFLLPYFTKAATIAELQALINQLQAQIQSLQAQIAAQSQGQTQWCHDFNVNLKIGDKGDEVKALRTVLIKEGFDPGDIPGGYEENITFSDYTASAVSGFQEKYKDEILTPLGLKYGTGFVGSATRKKLNSLYGCGKIVVQPPTITTIPSITVWQTYRNEKYGFEFRYSDENKGDIKDLSVYGAGNLDSYRCSTGNNPYYPNGYVNGSKNDIENIFHLNINNCEQIKLDIDSYANGEAHHKLKPFGDNPIISPIKIDGADARVISSKDTKYNDEELVILSPKPIIINNEPWGFIVIHTTGDLMKQILSTFKFIR